MAGFTKLWSDILTSSIWSEDDTTRIVWITLLALAERDGYVPASVSGLANAARKTVEETTKAINKLSAPDPESRTKDLEGRRIVEAPGGWMIVNYERLRARKDGDAKREYMADYMRKYREKRKTTSSANDDQPPTSPIV